jgi:regulator of cell morphogenesis and NO signaling
LDIQLGFGDKTIREICKEHGIDQYFFVELLQLIINKYEFDPINIHMFSIDLTVKYLKNSHKSYLEDYLPQIIGYIESLSLIEANRAKDCRVLQVYFKEYREEFNKHLKYEDTIVFPYILFLIEKHESTEYDSEFIGSIKKNSIKYYIRKHESLDEKLQDLKNLFIKYIHPFDNSTIVRSLLRVLYELEQDLRLHEMIENQILFKQAESIENNILSST